MFNLCGLGAAQRLERDHTALQLVVADDECQPRPGFVRAAELCLELGGTAMDHDAAALDVVAQLLGQRQGRTAMMS